VASQFIAEDNQYEIRGVLTLDASISYTYKQATIRLNARNLTGRKYETRGFGAMSVIPAQPFGLYSAFRVEL
jgi:outer membrane receptor protein involved in Fe transport